MKLFSKGALWIIGIYQKLISPLLPARCRYYPTCSAYGKQAILWHGIWYGGWLLLRRLCRCQPFGGSGIDFVPLPLYRFLFTPSSLMFEYVKTDILSYRAFLNHWLSSRHQK